MSGSELVGLVRSASWVIPKDELLQEVPAEAQAELKKRVVRGREELTRTILKKAREVVPQYGIELGVWAPEHLAFEFSRTVRLNFCY